MFHKSKLDQFAHRFPCDRQGRIPVEGDHWRDMDFERAGMDPGEAGISETERARRVAWLNTEWWPGILQRVEEERQRLQAAHGESFIKHWASIAEYSPDVPHGFEAG